MNCKWMTGGKSASKEIKNCVVYEFDMDDQGNERPPKWK